MTFEAAEADISALERLKWLVLGYDVTGVDVLADDRSTPTASSACSSSTPTCARSTPAPPTDDDDELLRSPQEYLHAFLRSLDAAAEGCPSASSPTSSARSRTTASSGLERTAALEEACHRLFLSQQRAGAAARRGARHPHAPARAPRPPAATSCAACSTG